MTADKAVNHIDRIWASFLKSKDLGKLKLLAHFAEDDINSIFTSTYFGSDVLEFQEALTAFHTGDDNAFQLLEERFRKTSSTYRSQLSKLTLLAHPVTEISIDNLVVGDSKNGLAITNSLLRGCNQLLEADAATKIDLLYDTARASLFDAKLQHKFCGTLLVDVPFIGMSIEKERVFLISLQSPLDAVYFPSCRLIIRSSSLRFSCVERLPKLFNWISRNLSLYESFWKQPFAKNVRFLVRDKRPYHVLLDELSGHYELQESSISLPTVFFERASFTEDAETINFSHPSKHIFSDILVSNHRRADKDNFSFRYYEYLKEKAGKRYGTPKESDSRTIIWVAISGGEKRRWLEEKTALKAFVEWARAHFADCHFYVDGWTSPVVMSDADVDQVAQHKKIWSEVCRDVKLVPSVYTSFIGSGILRKIWAASQAQFFISCAGTPSVWPSLICRVPGVVHNSVSMLQRVSNTYYPENVVRVPNEHIEDVNEIGNNIRWDKFSYSISVESILNCADSAYRRVSLNSEF